MKVKIITCHDVYNVGASLQAYALAKYLNTQGHETEIINYKPYYLRHYELTGVRNPRFDRPLLREIYQMLKLPGRVKAQFDPRKKAFDLFTNQHLPITEKRYKTNEELTDDPPMADVYIAGSDQIWNPVFQNGKDPAFFLDFVPDGRMKISYAASFAVDELSEENQHRMAQWLQSFDAISVREKSGVSLVHNMGLQACSVCDPVFLLDVEQWKCFLKENHRKPYLFVYDFDGNSSLMKIAKEMAVSHNLKIVSAFPTEEKTAEIVTGMGPIEFVNMIFYADLIISNSFHATAFSVIFEKNFYVMNRKEKINTRMRDLLLDLGLESRLISGLPDEMKEINWKIVNEKLTGIQKVSRDYLERNLG